MKVKFKRTFFGGPLSGRYRADIWHEFPDGYFLTPKQVSENEAAKARNKKEPHDGRRLPQGAEIDEAPPAPKAAPVEEAPADKEQSSDGEETKKGSEKLNV